MSDESRDKALKTAANTLEYHNRSCAALYKRLLEKDIEPQDAAYAVARLKELGLLDDVAYGRILAESYAARGYGAARVRQQLREKLLEPDDIDTIMRDFVPNGDKMRRYINSKLSGRQPDRRLIKNVSDGLVRRGFSWAEVREAMREYLDTLEEQ